MTPVTRGPRLRAVAHVNWGILDQALSSGTNFAISLLVVRSVTASEFGAFSVAVVVYIMSIGVVRAINTEPLTIRHGGDEQAVTRFSAASLGTAAAVGVVLGGVCLGVAALVEEPLASALAVLAVSFPLLLVQDSARIIAFARSRPRIAATNDLVWALVLVVLVVPLLLRPDRPVWQYTAAWLGSGAAAGVLAMWQLRARPRIPAAPAWLRDNRDLGVSLFLVYVLTVAPPYLLFAFAPLVSSLEELGHARAGFVPFGVFGVVLQGSTLLLLPFAARKPGDAVRRIAIRSSAALTASAALWGLLVVVATPASVGTWLMGDEWALTHDVQILFAVAVGAQAAAVGPLIGLRALEATGRLVRVRLVTAPLVLGGGLVLAARHGAIGIAWAVVAGDLLTAGLVWLQLHRVTGRPPRGRE